VATSDAPTGPFTIVNDDVQVYRSDVGVGDFGLFVDTDQTCYLSYNTIQNHQVSVEKLDDTYTASTMQNGGIIAEHMEAGSMFRREGKYYLLTDYTCCFCNQGSGARVYMSEQPLQGYRYTGNINRYPGRHTLLLSDGQRRGTQYEVVERAAKGFQSVEARFDTLRNIHQVQIDLFTGNRPENCGDVSNPRVHPEIEMPEWQIENWTGGAWQAVAVKDASVSHSALRQTITLEFDSFAASHIRLTPDSSYRFDQVYINEIVLGHGGTNTSFYISGPGIAQQPIVPAQQTFVMPLQTPTGTEYIWMGDLWGSASDNIKGHDYQYWSPPLRFRPDGTIMPMEFVDKWTLEVQAGRKQ
jgi:hypothetical protein